MTRRIVVLTALIAALVPAVAAQSMDIGVSPPTIDKGERQPGETFYGEFTVLTDADTDIDISLQTGTGSLRTFRRFKPDAAAFSAQDCSDCVRYLTGGGTLTEREETLDGGGQETDRWQTAKFVVELPEDIEPGHHLLTLTPQPTATGQGAVSLTSTASVQLFFSVPGDAVRSGKIIGIRADRNVDGEQRVTGTFYNNGTVTVRTAATFTVPASEGEETVSAGTVTVAPGETATFSTGVDTDLVNGSFPVRLSVDHGTGRTTRANNVTVAAPSHPEPVRQEPRPFPAAVILFLAFLAASSVITWKGVRYATG